MLGIVLVDQLGQAQRTGHSGGTSTDNDYIRLHHWALNIGKWLAKYDHARAFLQNADLGTTISNPSSAEGRSASDMRARG
jgi:hypothetical protein